MGYSSCRAVLAAVLAITPVVLAAGPPVTPEGRPDPLPPGAVARLGRAPFGADEGGHYGGAVLSPDGKLLAVTGRDIRLLDAATGREVRRISHPARLAGERPLRFSPDGKRLLLAGHRGLAICDLDKGESRTVDEDVRRMSMLTGATFTARGDLFAVGSQGWREKLSVSLWSADGKKVKTFEVDEDRSVEPALSPDGKVLATWGEMDPARRFRRDKDGRPKMEDSPAPTVQMWDVAAGKKSRALTLDGPCQAAVFSPDSKRLAIVEGFATLGIWDLASGKRVERFATRQAYRSAILVYSPDGKRLALGSQHGTVVQLWDLVVGRRAGQCNGPPNTFLTSIAFQPGNKALAAGSSGHGVRVWEVPSGRVRNGGPGHTLPVTALAFTAGGKSLLSAAPDGVLLWALPGGRLIRQLEPPRDPSMPYHPSRGQCLLSPGGRYVLWGEQFGRGVITAVEMATGQEVADIPGSGRHDGPPGTFAPDGRVFAATTLTYGRTRESMRMHVTAWDLDSGREVRKIILPAPAREGALAVAPGADRLALFALDDTRRAGKLTVHDFANGKLVASRDVGTEYRTSAAYSPDGSLLVTAGASVRVWDAATLDPALQLDEAKGLYAGAVAFSPDGRLLAVGTVGEGADLTIWELASGKVRGRYSGHRLGTQALAFSPDGKFLASGGADATVLLWDVRGSGKPPAAGELAALWDDLGGEDAGTAQRAMARLRAAPELAITLLRKRLRPAAGKALDAKELARLIAELGDESFEVRERATKALGLAGRTARPALLEAHRKADDLEVRRRLKELLEALASPRLSGEPLRQVRAAEVLEHLATPDARKLLTALAGGNPSARLTHDAAAALKRLPPGR